jgi:hypothetical protein
MTATEFFRRSREHEQELCRLIEDFCPHSREMDLYAGGILPRVNPVNAFKTALNARNYEIVRGILRATYDGLRSAYKCAQELLGYIVLTELLETKESKMIKKFYVGSHSIAKAIENGYDSRIVFENIEDATRAAKNVLRDVDSLDCTIVVEIKRIVRREKPTPPITVEEV